jgi:arsenate reductase
LPPHATLACRFRRHAIDPNTKRRNSCFRLSMPITIYGIKNCDTMKKARAWLDQRGVAYAFHDYKTAGIERAKLETWAKKAGWEILLNRAGTTFKKLPDKGKENITEKKAVALMLAQPSMIKRPVLELGGGKLLVGFKPEAYAASFK